MRSLQLQLVRHPPTRTRNAQRQRHVWGACVLGGLGLVALPGSCRPRQAWIRRAVREGSQTGASFRLCPLAQAEWLQKTPAEIQKFGVAEALCDVSYSSFGSAIMDGRSVLGSGRPCKRRTTPTKCRRLLKV